MAVSGFEKGDGGAVAAVEEIVGLLEGDVG